MRRVLAVACAVAVMSFVTAAAAEETNADRLFGEGRAAMQARAFAKAIPLLEESQRLDPAAGTLLNLAVCHAELGRTATAYRLFGEALFAAEQKGDVEQAELARERREVLVGKLATVRVVAAGDVVVAIDGEPITPAALARDVPLDPGAHRLVATYPSGRGWETSFATSVGRTSIEVPVDREPAALRPTEAPASTWSGLRIAGAATVTASLLAVGVATYFTVRAVDLRGESDDACPNGHCTRDGVALNDEARANGDRATAFAITGAVGLALGTVLYLVGRPTRRVDALAW